MPASERITQADLKSLISYSPETGLFHWVKSSSNRAPVGSIAGSPNGAGYLRIQIRKKNYYMHRLAVLWMTGEWPEADVDHINGDPSDNRWQNLRRATRGENLYNSRRARSNTTGYKGVTFRKDVGKFEGRIKYRRRTIHLGFFETAEEAHRAYYEKAVELRGAFANSGGSTFHR